MTNNSLQIILLFEITANLSMQNDLMIRGSKFSGKTISACYCGGWIKEQV
jgi:hypothetical protein